MQGVCPNIDPLAVALGILLLVVHRARIGENLWHHSINSHRMKFKCTFSPVPYLAHSAPRPLEVI